MARSTAALRTPSERIAQQLAVRYPVRCIVRRSERGLSSAVLAGFSAARENVLVVMDADLSHPPELVPQLVDPISRDDADFVLGSRYAAGGTTKARRPVCIGCPGHGSSSSTSHRV